MVIRSVPSDRFETAEHQIMTDGQPEQVDSGS